MITSDMRPCFVLPAPSRTPAKPDASAALYHAVYRLESDHHSGKIGIDDYEAHDATRRFDLISGRAKTLGGHRTPGKS